MYKFGVLPGRYRSLSPPTALGNVKSGERLAGCEPGKSCLPHARNKTLRPCRVHCVFIAKLLDHHPLLRHRARFSSKANASSAT